jgi:hypothetical protein
MTTSCILELFYFIVSLLIYGQIIPQFLHIFSRHCLHIHGARNRKFITIFTRACLRFLSWTNWIHSTLPQLISLRSILIPSSHLCLDLPSWLFPSGFSIQKPCTLSCPLPCVPHVPPSSFSLIWSANDIWRGLQIMKLLITVYTTLFQFTDSPCRTCFLHAGYFSVEYQRHCTVSHTNICVALNVIINIIKLLSHLKGDYDINVKMFHYLYHWAKIVIIIKL